MSFSGTCADEAGVQLCSWPTNSLDSPATEICQCGPLRTSSQMLFKSLKPFFCPQQMWGSIHPFWKYQKMRLRGETAICCVLWGLILVKPQWERWIVQKLSPSMPYKAGVRLYEWPYKQLNGKLALLKWKEYYGLGGIGTCGWDLWLRHFLSISASPL